MNVVLQTPWTVERFLDWVGRQEGRYEFDGTQPVGMVGGTANHSFIIVNIHMALRPRLRETGYTSFGPDLAVRTVGNAVRYPDVVIPPANLPGDALLAADPVVVFEVLSSDSGRRDRIEKVREYGGVTSIRRYILVETEGLGLVVLFRAAGEDAWMVETLIAEDVLAIPELGIEMPVAEIYDGVTF